MTILRALKYVTNISLSSHAFILPILVLYLRYIGGLQILCANFAQISCGMTIITTSSADTLIIN